MKTFNALSVLQDDEVHVYRENVNFIQQALSSKLQEDRFTRVIRIKGFPDLSISDVKIDISKLIELRNSKECVEFRDWLRTIDDDTDIELFERLEGFKSKLSELFNSTSGKIIWILCGLGLPPVTGPLIGLGLSALDIFLLSKVLQKSGPISFINKRLPSVFKQDWQKG